MQSKVIVLTGASGGIGAVLAKRLGAQGHRLVLGARRIDELRAVAQEAGPTALAIATDVTKRRDLENLRDQALQAFGQIDVWINNAGQGLTKFVLDTTDEDFDQMMLVNTKSALYGMQAVVPHFQMRGTGHLINVSSFLARVPLAPVRAAYSASKAALNSLTTNLRMDLAEKYPGIHVSIVMPGIVATDFAKNAASAGKMEFQALPTSGPMAAQTPQAVADRILELIAKPQAEIYTNPRSPGMAARFFETMGAFRELS